MHVAPQADGGAVICGTFTGTLPLFGKELEVVGVSGVSDVFLAGLTKDGAVRWAGSLSLPGDQTCADVAVDNENAVYVSGAYEGTPDFGGGRLPATVASSGRTPYLVKFRQKL